MVVLSIVEDEDGDEDEDEDEDDGPIGSDDEQQQQQLKCLEEYAALTDKWKELAQLGS